MSQATQPKHIAFYTDEKGRKPFTRWLEGLRNEVDRKRILARIGRLEKGNYGDCESVGEGVHELRMFFGSGYRIYFAEEEGNIVILLCGGDKKTQDTDIRQAKLYWKEYQSHAS